MTNSCPTDTNVNDGAWRSCIPPSPTKHMMVTKENKWPFPIVLCDQHRSKLTSWNRCRSTQDVGTWIPQLAGTFPVGGFENCAWRVFKILDKRRFQLFLSIVSRTSIRDNFLKIIVEETNNKQIVVSNLEIITWLSSFEMSLWKVYSGVCEMKLAEILWDGMFSFELVGLQSRFLAVRDYQVFSWERASKLEPFSRVLTRKQTAVSMSMLRLLYVCDWDIKIKIR